MTDGAPATSATDLAADPTFLRARRKALWHLLPLLFVSYVIAYIDRANVSIAKLTMMKDLPGFDNAVFGFGAGVFFIGYFLLEVPGSLIVERWSARKWLARIMVTWGIMAALTAVVKTPTQFYVVRFLLGLAEAGFFPGVIVYLSHWFTVRDRAKTLSYFFIANPFALVISPKISNWIIKIGTDEVVDGTVVHHPEFLGLEGWQWIYIFWGAPAVILGFGVLFFLPDKPVHAQWLSAEERGALEGALARDKADNPRKHVSVLRALSHPKVLLLALGYFCAVTASYGIEFFLPTILRDWYHLKIDTVTTLVLLPPIFAVTSQLFVGWSSDRTKERRLHTVVPWALAAVALFAVGATRGHLALTLACFVVSSACLKAYMPAFWALPGLFLGGAAAAGSIGLINSIGNLGGFLGPFVLGKVEALTGSFQGGLIFVGCACVAAVVVVLSLRLGDQPSKS